MENPRKITEQQFEDGVRQLLFGKPKPSAIPDEYEPTEEELEQVYRVESTPSEQDE